MRLMLLQGSPRRKDNCPDQWGKTKLLVDYLIRYAPRGLDIDYCDLSVGPDTRIGPCKGCVSTANGFHCHYPCDCYAPNAPDPANQDFMHDANIYGRLEACDGFLVLTPINWYGVSSQLKLFFDRLTCINLTITADQARELGINKDAKKSSAAEQSGQHHQLLKNHYEGKFGGFLIHGNDGGADYREFVKGKPKHLPTLPKSYTDYAKDSDGGWVNKPINNVMNLVWQCRYSGIFVPSDCIVGLNVGSGLTYSEGMLAAVTDEETFYSEGLALMLRLVEHIKADA